MTYQEWEDKIDQLTHDAEHAEAGAAMARKMGDRGNALALDRKASKLRSEAADLSINVPKGGFDLRPLVSPKEP